MKMIFQGNFTYLSTLHLFFFLLKGMYDFILLFKGTTMGSVNMFTKSLSLLPLFRDHLYSGFLVPTPVFNLHLGESQD